MYDCEVTPRWRFHHRAHTIGGAPIVNKKERRSCKIMVALIYLVWSSASASPWFPFFKRCTEADCVATAKLPKTNHCFDLQPKPVCAHDFFKGCVRYMQLLRKNTDQWPQCKNVKQIFSQQNCKEASARNNLKGSWEVIFACTK
jgi:hypothetical protein